MTILFRHFRLTESIPVKLIKKSQNDLSLPERRIAHHILYLMSIACLSSSPCLIGFRPIRCIHQRSSCTRPPPAHARTTQTNKHPPSTPTIGPHAPNHPNPQHDTA